VIGEMGETGEEDVGEPDVTLTLPELAEVLVAANILHASLSVTNSIVVRTT